MARTHTYKLRIYPTDIQQTKLNATLDACRWLYNYLLNKNLRTKEDMQFALTELKEEESWLRLFHSKMLQMIPHKIDKARKALRELRKKGYDVGKLRYARHDDYNTFTYNQSGFKVEKHAKLL